MHTNTKRPEHINRRLRHILEKSFDLQLNQWNLIKDSIEYHSYKKGDVLKFNDTNNICDKIFFIHTGVIIGKNKFTNDIWHIFYNFPNSKKRSYSLSLIQDFYSYIQQTKSNIKFEAASDCTVLSISLKTLSNILTLLPSNDKELHEYLSIIESERLKQHLSEHTSRHSLNRLLQYKKKHLYAFLQVPPEDILSYLGICDSIGKKEYKKLVSDVLPYS
jgi:hypothetical protein